jgi:phosphoribosylformylglycinamidine synthase
MDSKVLADIEKRNQVVFRYCDFLGQEARYPFNPNGSVNAIAGICNEKGNVLGMMPHPERYIYKWQHYDRSKHVSKDEFAWGLRFFKNAVNSVK